MRRTLLIDGDVFCYQAAAACEHSIAWCDEVHTLEANFSEAKAKLQGDLDHIMTALHADSMAIALSDNKADYWRRDVLPSYKLNRVAKRKPLVLLPLREFLEDRYDARIKPTLEGDDVLGILSTHPTLILGEKIIVSIDKDMKTIPGLFCRNLDHNENFIEITPPEADYWHMMQTLTGDSTDGYKGCPGMGPVSAKKILDGAVLTGCLTQPVIESMWPAVVAAYKKAGLNEAQALIQAQVARICRHTDYDFKEKKPILWTPPQATAPTPSPLPLAT